MQRKNYGVHEISDQYVSDFAALDPMTASYLGFSEYDEHLTDFSPDGYRARAELGERALRALGEASPAKDSERLAKEVFEERVGLEVEIHQAGLDIASFNTVQSPVWSIRQTFDMMPTETADQWSVIAKRLAKVPDAVAGVRASLTYALDQGTAPALRQVTKVAEQCDTWSGLRDGRSFFTTLICDLEGVEGVSNTLRTELVAGAQAATEAYADFSSFLRDEIAPKTPDRDAVGEDAYRLWSRYFTGIQLDLADAYEWGWTEFSRIEHEMKQVADRIKPGSTLAEVATTLDADPRYQVRGQEALQAYLQQLSDNALAELRDVHFEIPDELMRLDCRIAPVGGSVGTYYAAPTDDFSRPASMWWSVPPNQEVFPIWREISVVYHEGVPGHHLQVGTAVYQAARLNRFQRLIAFVSAHAEGWALYGERLMRELGYLEEDGPLLGMLLEQQLRAARVILDIGMHLQLQIPAGTGFHEGERWTPELGLEFMLTHTISAEAYVRDEIDRYLGWAGQAPGYKLGERVWLSAVADARRRHGADFDLKRFHSQALEMGSVGLDILRERLAAF